MSQKKNLIKKPNMLYVFKAKTIDLKNNRDELLNMIENKYKKNKLLSKIQPKPRPKSTTATKYELTPPPVKPTPTNITIITLSPKENNKDNNNNNKDKESTATKSISLLKETEEKTEEKKSTQIESTATTKKKSTEEKPRNKGLHPFSPYFAPPKPPKNYPSYPYVRDYFKFRYVRRGGGELLLYPRSPAWVEFLSRFGWV